MYFSRDKCHANSLEHNVTSFKATDIYVILQLSYPTARSKVPHHINKEPQNLNFQFDN